MSTVGNERVDVDVPATMEVTALETFGSPDVLKTQRAQVPEPGPTKVLIAIHAAGVGVWDLLMRDGSWQPCDIDAPPGVLGTDGAGVVVKVGSQVKRFAVGDRVFGYGFGGFYAEYTVVDESRVGLIPEHMSYAEAAAAAVPGLTDLQGLIDILKLSAGQIALVVGASGALGTLAIQFAKALRARVLASASGTDAKDLVLRLGTDGVFDTRRKDGLDQLRQLAPTGVDAALILGAGSVLEQCLDLVRPGGSIAYPYGVNPEPRPRDRVRVVGYNLEAGPKDLDRMTRLSHEAYLRVPIAQTYALADASEAHKRLEKGHVLGRVILQTRLAT